MAFPTSSSADQRLPRVRPIGVHMAMRLAIPTYIVVALCVAAIVVAAVGRPIARVPWDTSHSARQQALADSAVLTGAATVAAVIIILLAASYIRRLSRDISDLTLAAQALANDQLPRVIRRLRESEPTASGAHATGAVRHGLEAEWLAARVQRTSTAELASALSAITSIERTAVEAATAEARLRGGLRQILMSLGRRNQSLLHRQLKIIDHLEQQAASPGELADLFSLDHLTTRMRRHAESLTILSGASPIRSWSSPVPVIDVIRAAVAEIEDYKRVTVAVDTEESIAASAVTDMIHLLAELIENATLFSPSATRVEVRAERVANGFAIEVEDRGLGIAAAQLREINQRLASPPDFDLADADRLGLFVAGRLAARQGARVELIPSAYRGTKAVVVLPLDLITTSVAPADAESPLRGVARLNVAAPEALTLVGATASWPAATGGSLPNALAADSVSPAAGAESFFLRRDGLPRRTRPGQPKQPGQPSASGAAPPPKPARPTEPAQPGEPPRRLPRRVRPESADQLSTGGPVRMPGGPQPAEAPAPERARNLAASLQRGWLRSRAADEEASDSDLGVPDRAPGSEEI